ncbi:MAG: PT domain-containing protein [Anaerolineaceae bacterium]
MGTYDDRHAALSYSGSWQPWNTSGPYGGTYMYASTAGDVVSLRFSGTNVSLVYDKNITRGSASISIDGVQAATINAYASSLLWQQRWDSGTLASGTHTITVTFLGGGRYFDMDAFIVNENSPAGPTTVPTNVPTSVPTTAPTVVPTNTPVNTLVPGGTPTPTGTSPVGVGTYDDRHAALSYSGSWQPWNTSGPYGGTYMYASTAGDVVSLRFSGTNVSLVYDKNITRGSASISIDGVQAATINAYASSLLWQQRWDSSTLASGSHTITVTFLGGGRYFDMDALIIRN